MKEGIRSCLFSAGAVAVGFARAGNIEDSVHNKYEAWIRKGYNGEMKYLERHIPLRRHTDHVLQKAKTVISLAFDYTPREWRSKNLPVIAAYAYGDDYHSLLREKLKPILLQFKNQFGGEWRICIDSAPVAERFWAMKSGIGIRGKNGSVIIKGYGSFCFLAEILTTIDLEADKPSTALCKGCGLCVESCPGKAIIGDGCIDSRRCINYLTIEKKGEFNNEELEIVNREEGHLFGCDRCLKVCPYNHSHESETKVFFPIRAEIASLNSDNIIGMDKERFGKLFKNSPLLYSGYDRLLRNAGSLIKDK